MSSQRNIMDHYPPDYFEQMKAMENAETDEEEETQTPTAPLLEEELPANPCPSPSFNVLAARKQKVPLVKPKPSLTSAEEAFKRSYQYRETRITAQVDRIREIFIDGLDNALNRGDYQLDLIVQPENLNEHASGITAQIVKRVVDELTKAGYRVQERQVTSAGAVPRTSLTIAWGKDEVKTERNITLGEL